MSISGWMCGVLAILAVGATAYHLLVLFAARRFGGRAPAAPRHVGLVSVLKPVAGADASLEANLRTHLEQSYPDFEVILAAEEADLVLTVAQSFVEESGGRATIVRAARAAPNSNPKVALLEAAAAEARGEILALSDADISVSPDWLARVVAPLADPSVGLVTCLYRARPGRTFSSLLDALWISAEFPGQVLAADRVEGVRFGLGATIALRRADLDRAGPEGIGGFAVIAPFLADDYELGARIHGLGLRVELSREVVETTLGDATWREVWKRHLRWSRTIRASRPWGHLGLLWTHATVWSLALLAVSQLHGAWWMIAVLCMGVRLLSAAGVAWAVDARWVPARLPWILLADLGSFAAWIGAFGSRGVEWRGRRLELDRGGRIR